MVTILDNMSQKTDLDFKYVPLDELVPLKGNSKKHDTETVKKSIEKYGFRDPIEIDLAFTPATIVAGHDRRNALLQLRSQKLPVPRGVKIDNKGNWAVPCIFYQSESEALGVGYSIDNNYSTIKGAGFNIVDELKLFDPEELLGQIEYLHSEEEEVISSINIEDLLDLLNDSKLTRENTDSEQEEIEDDDEFIPDSNVRMVQLFLDDATHPIFLEYINTLSPMLGADNYTDCVMGCLRQLYEAHRIKK